MVVIEVDNEASARRKSGYLAAVREDPTTVLFIAGSGRSGSTLLGQVLSGVPEFVHVGELNFIWEHNVLQNRSCGCGKPFRECEFWTEVMAVAFGGFDAVDAHEMVRLQQRGTRTRHALQLLMPGTRSRIVHRSQPFTDTSQRLYQAIREVSGAAVVVDSSKLPPYGFLQGQTSGIDLRCVHLVRDPRATAYSWLRRASTEQDGGAAYLPPIGTAESSLTWMAWNIITELLWRKDSQRYLRIRYEDFVREPQQWSQRMTGLAGKPQALLPFDAEGRLNVGVAHTVAGNPNRFDSGSIGIRADQEWESRIATRQRLAVTALTFPVLHRYDYPVAPSRKH